MAPYRGDHQPFQRFGQHVGVAEELLSQFDGIPRRLAEDITHEHLEQLKGEARAVWEGVWDHLRQASEIARGMGRPVGGYAGARAEAGDIYAGAIHVHVGPWEPNYAGGKRRTITWHNAPTKPAVDAIAALRAAVPEVVVTRAPVPDVDLRSHGWLLDWWAALVIVLIAGLIVWQCVV